MDYLRTFAISAWGMNVERARVEVASLNLANAHTVQAPGVPGYQPMRVVAQAGPSFAALLGGGDTLSDATRVTLQPALDAPRRVHEPGHPFADARGFVTYPGVDPATEMVTLMSATRAYEANLAAMNMARSLALKTLEIGRTP